MTILEALKKLRDDIKIWVSNNIRNLLTKIDEKQDIVKITGTTTKQVGGIPAGTSLDEKPVDELLNDMLFPYVKFTFNGISTTESSTTYELGKTVTISKVKPSYTAGSVAINSIKIGTTSGGEDLYSGTSATSGSDITLTTTKTFNGNTGGTIYCTISDGTTATEKTATVSYAAYTYYAVTDDTNTPATWTPVGSTSTSDISITANAGQFIWIASTNNYSGICELNELSGKYNTAAATTKLVAQSLTNAQGKTIETYIFYRLSEARAGSGTSKFKLS